MAVLTEEQTMLRDQASNWVREKSPVTQFRAMRDHGFDTAFDPAIWQQIAELGWCGILVPEEYGGSGMDYATFGVILEQTGRGLSASPLLASCLVGASALLLGGNDEQKKSWLPGIAAGDIIATLAVDEGPHHAPGKTALEARAEGSGYVLSGEKTFVMEGFSADLLIVAARTSGAAGDQAGITLFLVPADANGVSRRRLTAVDHRGWADITFDGVRVDASAVLGEADNGFPLLDGILDRGRAGIAAEMLGIGAEAFDRTLEYIKTREQFGQVIGSFQVIGHRAATHFMNMEMSRSCVEAALASIDEGADNIAVMASLAKCQVGDFLHDMSNDMIQMHGGIGMTDEFDAGFFLKRARTTETVFGNQSFHRQRYIGYFGI